MNTLNLIQTAQCVEYNLKKNIPSFIWGPPGIGKSDCVKQVAEKLGMGLIDMRLSLRDPVDLRGLPMLNVKAGTAKWLVPEELPNLKRDGKKGVLFLDECNTASSAVQSAAMGLVLDRRLGEYELPKGWIPIAAGNRMLDRAAAQRMGTALKNRFAHFEVVFDLDSWIAWAESVQLNPVMIGWSKFRPGLMHQLPTGDDNSFPTPRSWAQVAKLIDAPDSIRQYLVSALVGAGPAAEFEAFARVYETLTGIIEIAITTPAKAKVPDTSEPSVKFALGVALARRAKVDNFGNVLIYAKRLPKEYEVFIAVEAIRCNPSLKETRAFTKWFVYNQEVLI